MKKNILCLFMLLVYINSNAQPGTSLDTNNVRITNLSMNSSQSDFGVSLFQNGIMYSKSNLSVKKLKLRKASSAFMHPNLYFSGTNTDYKEQKKFKNELKKKGNYGYATYHAKSRTIYYVVNNSPRNKSTIPFNQFIYSTTYNFARDQWEKPLIFSYNSKLYSCTQPFLSEDGTRLYFSSNMYGGYGGMDIYYCIKKEGYWSKPVNLGPKVNTAGNEGYPFLDNYNNLYFSSDGRGGMGGTDIFLLNLTESSAITENLGFPFNSPAEDFAYVRYPNSTKGFFSSTRGKEKYDSDIYAFERLKTPSKQIDIHVLDGKSNQKLDSVYAKIYIKGSKDTVNTMLVNGSLLDFEVKPRLVYEVKLFVKGYDSLSDGMYINTQDSVYEFKLNKIVELCSIHGLISNKINGKKIVSALISITNTENEKEQYKTISNIFGAYNFVNLPKNEFYEITVSAVGYFYANKIIQTIDSNCIQTNSKDINQYNFELFSGKATRIEKVYFDLNKSVLKDESKKELDKLVKMMKDNPKIIVELSSHTDARGSDKLNLALSQARSNSCVNYIISQGIEKARIIAVGYGESRLLNKCKDDVQCSEENHQKNRRTEFQVVGVR